MDLLKKQKLQKKLLINKKLIEFFYFSYEKIPQKIIYTNFELELIF
jgi:hypothetical protein